MCVRGRQACHAIQAAAFRVWSGSPSTASPQQLAVVSPAGF